MVLFTFVAVFVAASGGLFFIIHHCSAHHVTEFKFVKQEGEDCCHHAIHENQACEQQQSCCSGNGDVEQTGPSGSINCCTNSSVFLKVPFQFLKSSVEKIQVPVLFISDALAPVLKLTSGDGYLYNTPQFCLPPGEFPVMVATFTYSMLRL